MPARCLSPGELISLVIVFSLRPGFTEGFLRIFENFVRQIPQKTGEAQNQVLKFGSSPLQANPAQKYAISILLI